MTPRRVESTAWHRIAVTGAVINLACVALFMFGLVGWRAYLALICSGVALSLAGLYMRDDGMKSYRRIRGDARQIAIEYHCRKRREPDLRRWEFVVQMLCSAYFTWRWLSGRFRPLSIRYWAWLAQYSSLYELQTRAALAVKQWQREQGINGL